MEEDRECLCGARAKYSACSNGNGDHPCCEQHYKNCILCESERTTFKKKPALNNTNNSKAEKESTDDSGYGSETEVEWKPQESYRKSAWTLYQESDEKFPHGEVDSTSCPLRQKGTKEPLSILGVQRWAGHKWMPLLDGQPWIVNDAPSELRLIAHGSGQQARGPLVTFGAQLSRAQGGVKVRFKFMLFRKAPSGDCGALAPFWNFRKKDGTVVPLNPEFGECKPTSMGEELVVSSDDNGYAQVTLRLPPRARFRYAVAAALEGGDWVWSNQLVVWQEVVLEVERMQAPAICLTHLEPYAKSLTDTEYGDRLNLDELVRSFGSWCIRLTIVALRSTPYTFFPADFDGLSAFAQRSEYGPLCGLLSLVECVIGDDPSQKTEEKTTSADRAEICTMNIEGGKTDYLIVDALPFLHRVTDAELVDYSAIEEVVVCKATLAWTDQGVRLQLLTPVSPGQYTVQCINNPKYINGVNLVDKWIVQVAVAGLTTVGESGALECLKDGEVDYAAALLGTMRHELLHMLGLEHCKSELCVMYWQRTKSRGNLPCRRCLSLIGNRLLTAMARHSLDDKDDMRLSDDDVPDFNEDDLPEFDEDELPNDEDDNLDEEEDPPNDEDDVSDE